MIQETDTLKADIADTTPQMRGAAVSGAAGFMAAIRTHPMVLHPLTGKVLRISKLIAGRFYAYSGELFAMICGLGIAWLYAMSWLLTQQSVDISRFKPDAERWFLSAFDGNSAKVDTLSLRWLPASDSVVLEIQNMTVRDAEDQIVQNFTELKTSFPLRRVVTARPVPSVIDIRGGTLSWVEDENGVVTAGLGMPETVGRLGPVYRGEAPKLSQPDSDHNLDFQQALATFKSLNVEDTILYYQNKIKDIDIVLDLNNLTVIQENEQIDLDVSGLLRQSDGPAPVNLTLKTNARFSDFEGRAIGQAVRLDELAPRKGRYRDLSRVVAPVSFDVQTIFSQIDGLQASQITLDVGKGSVAGFTQPLDFESAKFMATLEPGAQRMSIETIALNSSKFSFMGEGDITELGAINDGNINSSPVFDVKLKDIAVNAMPVFTGPLIFQSIAASGQIDLDARRLSLPKLSIGLDGYGFDLAVDIVQNAQGDKLDKVSASGQMTGSMGPQELLALWPVNAVDGARRWVDSSVKAASIDKFSFNANFDADYFENPVFTEDNITADLEVSQAVVKYLRTMPALQNVTVQGQLRGNRIDADVLSGTVGNLVIERGSVQMPQLLPIGGDLIINMTGTGQASEMLSLIDNKPFEFASKYDVDPAKVGGQGRIDMTITRPLLVYFDQNRITYAVKGDFTDATAPFEIMGQKITEGHVRLEADKTGLWMSGPVKIGPWAANMEWREVFGPNPPPTSYMMSGLVNREVLDEFGLGLREYFDGTIPLEIKALGRGLDIQSGSLTADLTDAQLSVSNIWSKAAGQNGTLVAALERGAQDTIVLSQLDLKAGGVEILGQLEMGRNLQLKLLDFSKMRVDGLIDAAVQLKPDTQNQRFSLFVEGDYLDVSPWVKASFNTRNTSAIDVPVLMTTSLKQLVLKDEYVLSDAKFLLNHSGTSIMDLRLGGTVDEGAFTAEIVNNPDDGTRIVSVNLPNASKAADAFLGLTSTQGGKLGIKAKLPPIDGSGPTVGTAIVTEFKLKQAPFLAQILSLASLSGLVDTLGGEGLAFENFEVPFTLENDLLQIRGARIYGAALGMTGDGDIQLKNRVLDFDGTLVPAYNANTILTDIPVLGSLIGKKGEGVFALNYAVKGPFEKAQISVNPLSALTPGFLRGIFRSQREKIPDDVMEQIEAVRPKTDE